MKDQLKILRKTIKLSQEEFGNRIGISKSAVSNMEAGRYSITESMIKLICREFNVDYLWLTTGQGEMFFEKDFDIMESIEHIMSGENELHKNLIKTFAKFDTEDLLALEKMIDKFLDTKKSR